MFFAHSNLINAMNWMNIRASLYINARLTLKNDMPNPENVYHQLLPIQSLYALAALQLMHACVIPKPYILLKGILEIVQE